MPVLRSSIRLVVACSFVVAASALGCAGGPAPAAPQPAGARAPSSDTPGPAASTAAPALPSCQQSADCPNDNPCAPPACVRGQCQPGVPAEVTRCDLPQELLERQLALRADGRAAGVCHRGECIPRTMCSELCAGDLGEDVARKLGPAVERCNREFPDHNDTWDACLKEVMGRNAPLRQYASKKLAECMVSCGFDPIDLSQAEFL